MRNEFLALFLGFNHDLRTQRDPVEKRDQICILHTNATVAGGLANLLFIFELDRRARAAGSGLTAAVAHPGYANTNLQSGTSFQWSNFMAQSAADGALPMLYAATAPDVQGGEFFGPGGFMQQHGAPKRVKASKKAYDTDSARRLWDVSEQLTGVKYQFS